jgi:hypothetical protein
LRDCYGERAVDDVRCIQLAADQAGPEIEVDRFLLVCDDAIVDQGKPDLRPCQQFNDTEAGIFISLPQVSA